MNKPVPYKIGSDRFISEKTFKALKVNAFLQGLQVVKYCEMELVIDEYLGYYADAHTAENAWKHLIKVFKTLSTKHQNVAVKSFSTSLKQYYFQRKQKFLELYDQKLELMELDQRTQHEGDKAGAEVIKQGVMNGKRRMEKVYQKATTTKKRKQSDSSATSRASMTISVGATPILPKLANKIPAKSLKSASSPESSVSSTSIPIHSQVTSISISTSSPIASTSVPTTAQTSCFIPTPPIPIPINSPRLSPSSNFINVPTKPDININQVKETLLSEAKSIHGCFMQGNTIQLHDFKRMSTGLSSILDLVDLSENSQRQLFPPLEWEAINKYFAHIYKRRQYSLSPMLKNTWGLISVFCEKTNTTSKSKEYLKKMMEAEEKKHGSDSEAYRILGIFSFMLDLYDENSWMFDVKTKKSEFDFLSIIWAPLLRKMVHTHNNIIEVKGGETTNPYTQFMRQMQYESNRKVVGLKIDLRFVVTVTGIDVDIGAVEAANELPADTKIQEDAGKLLVETKDIVDGLLNSIHEITDVREVSGVGIQVAGLAGQASNLHIYKPKTYVAVPGAKLSIPSNIRSLASFAETFENLMTSIIDMERLAIMVIKSSEFFEDRRRSFGKNFNTTSANQVELDYVHWIASSWYPPINNNSKESQMPIEETASPPSPPFAAPDHTVVEYDQKLVDEYGWVFLGDKYYNIETNVFEFEHPFANDDD